MTQTFLPYPKEKVVALQVLAMRYLEEPTGRKEEQVLVLLEDAIRRQCDRIVSTTSDPEDILQIARIASTRALRSYNPLKGSFYHWSRTCVYRDMGNYFKTEGLLIRIPRDLKGKVSIDIISLSDLEAMEESNRECDKGE
jgi:DNA-directed RNA polymerase specialized sigma subunit